MFNYGDILVFMNGLRNCYYRVSAKALVLNEARDKFLLCKKETGFWELPGGGLDWGTTPQEDIPREVDEEMGLAVAKVAENPSYFATCQNETKEIWVVNVIYETELEHLNFKRSDECIEIKFVNKEDIESVNAIPTVKKLAEMFKPENHSS